jgi:8-oxo-dGTP diphosphatase
MAASPFYLVIVEGAIYHEDRYLLIVRGPGEDHAAGALSLVGGKVDTAPPEMNVLEATLRREIREEVGVEVDEIEYVLSVSFTADDGTPCVNVVFLCRYAGGEPRIADAGEVAAMRWMRASDVENDPAAPRWTRENVALAEQRRQARPSSNSSEGAVSKHTRT